MNLSEMINNYGPVLLSSSVLGTMFTILGPSILKKMKKNFKYKQILTLYNSYKKNPEMFERTYPGLTAFFVEKGWLTCKCNNCAWLRTKIRN